ncbi:MAG: undecaprenyl/decaprenyl-phosphate alpha-N-acetylglucosaminyl 1-phosphate transferase [Planctomycetes bacterium]|nr:undecaprenyl/decaprenyl-phosphate alpha-N-acetylglucosaminyl 1-phosphate transferase [Planctomycetota bacterium]
MSAWIYVALALAAALLALGATALARRVALSTGFLDRPEGRKDHGEAVPYLGGAAVVFVLLAFPSAGLLVASGIFGGVPGIAAEALRELADAGRAWAGLALGLVLACAGGTWDDRVKLAPRVKLALQCAAALCPVVLAELRFDWALHELLGAAGAALWIVAAMNAFNFLDNMNGVLTGVVASLTLPFFALAWVSDQVAIAAALAVTCGACLGFLPFNFPRARIFLGDGGSQALGYWIGALAVQASYLGPGTRCALAPFLVPPALLALPLLDLAHVVWSRRRLGVPISRGDHRHVSHRLAQRTGSKRRAAFACWGATFVLGALAAPLPWCSPLQASALVAAQVALFLWVGGLPARGARSH